jgi:hypothetical protein
VAFLSEFLLEHSLTTKQVFQRVLQEAKGALGTTPMEEKEKYTKMRELPLPHQHEQQTTFQKGVVLGRQLDNLDDASRVLGGDNPVRRAAGQRWGVHHAPLSYALQRRHPEVS